MFISCFGVRSPLPEPHNYIFGAPLWPSALGSRLVRLIVKPALLHPSKMLSQTARLPFSQHPLTFLEKKDSL